MLWQRYGGVKTPLKNTCLFFFFKAVSTRRRIANSEEIIQKKGAREREPQILNIKLCPSLYLTPPRLCVLQARVEVV